MSSPTIKRKGESCSVHGEPPGSKSRIAGRQPSMPVASQRLAQLAEAQGVPVVKDVADLAVDFWPEDESADSINSYIYRQRYDDRMRA